MLNKFQSPGDVAFRIFDFPVYYYGIIMAFAVFCGFCIAYLLFKKYYDKENNIILDISSWLIIAGIIGARLYYCLVNFSYYTNKPLEIFYIRQGGLSVHGMIIGGLLALLFFSKKYKISFWKFTDVFLCGTALAQCIGRWGNFFNSEAFGLPCNMPWKLYIPISERPLEYINCEYFHPTFLYESILDLFIFIILLLLFKRFSNNTGVITGLYLIFYSVIRIFVESLRIDSVLNIIGIPIAQIVSVLFLIFGICLLFYKTEKQDI